MERSRWYKDAIVYQIYPRSFCDSNGDGIGDIQGIISKLDYIKSLGVNAVWISPYFKSPNDDNGYDISDYRDIMDEFGTLEDWQQLVDGLHGRGIKLIMDLVVNHSSDEHEWFKESRKNKDNNNIYRDYYIWRKGRGKNGLKPPNNWTSRFGGPAWSYDENTSEWYLHLFSKKQPDLNWDNPKVRDEIVDICEYWCNLGVDGFRCDVIIYISKDEGLPNGKYNPAMCGDEHFSITNKYHEYVHELYERSWKNHDIMTVGEGPGLKWRHGENMMAEERGELDSVFTFEYQDSDSFMHIIPRKFKLSRFKNIINNWQTLPQSCWNSIFLENHDFPRVTPRFISREYREIGAKMLAMSMYMLRGTPYIYQGQEIAMTNYEKYGVEDYVDVASVNTYKVLKKMFPPLLPLARWALYHRARDHARSPMQWDDTKGAGFTTGEPWIRLNPNYKDINVRENEGKSGSVLEFYRKINAFRLGNDIIRDGEYCLYMAKSNSIYMYERTLGERAYLVVANWTDKEKTAIIPQKFLDKKGEIIMNNYEDKNGNIINDIKTKLRAYESIIIEIK